tara:strand:- start:916 stop:1101 length:186 start_codon:yes stop_codon:yes gene_type:complete
MEDVKRTNKELLDSIVKTLAELKKETHLIKIEIDTIKNIVKFKYSEEKIAKEEISTGWRIF